MIIKKYKGGIDKDIYKKFILGGDIGGTNANLGIFGIKNKFKNNFPKLIISFHFKELELSSLHHAINEALEHAYKACKIKAAECCLAVAGVLSPDRAHAKITNIKWVVSKKSLLEKTALKSIILVNDFEAVGYGINMLAKKDIEVIKKAKKIARAPIAVIGAGTGLGKSVLIYDRHCKSYIPIRSEGGHADFSSQSRLAFELANFIKKHKKIKESVSYEQVLSGKGICNIYLFLRKNKNHPESEFTGEIDNAKNQPELISKYRRYDETCKEVFKIYKIIYAEFARNSAIDCLALGGVYIAGGIAPKNKEIFDADFVKAFGQNYKMADILKKIPVYLILNCNVGLLGAGFAAVQNKFHK